MKKRNILPILVALCALLMASSALAMSSAHYRLDWFVPLSGSGGALQSTNYQASLTIGQVAIGMCTSENYGAGLGYWYGVLREWFAHLPIVLKVFPR